MKKHNLSILFGTMMFIMLLSCQPTTKYIYIHDDNTSDTNNHGSTTSSTTVATVPSGNNNGKITKLQDIVDNAQANSIIDCSQYQITDYNATVNKQLTIKNANMQGDTLKVLKGGVVLNNITKVSVNTNASLKIANSSLSSLSIGNVTNDKGELMYPLNAGRGDTPVTVELEGDTFVRSADLDLADASITTDSTADIENIEVRKNAAIKGNAANIRLAGSKIKLEVTDLSADNVTFVGNNTTLCVMDRTSCIMNVETDEDVVCQLEMEDGPYANMSNPTVRGENGKLTRIDKTKDAVLEKLSIDQMPEKIAYSADETLDLTGLQIVETYRTSGIVEFTFEGGQLVETYTRLEANPLANTAYSFKMKAQNVPAIGYKFKEADKGENTIVITKTDESTVISTEALKVVVLKDDELAISYVGAEAEQLEDLPKVFKKSQNVVIPTNMTKDGFVFAGWYENNNIGPITGWEANTKESSVTLYARWINMLYVDPDLTDDTGTGAYNMPFKMIEQAVAAITSTGSYTIVPMKDIDKVGKIYLTKDFPVKITIQPEIGTVSIGDGSKYEYDPEYYNEDEFLMFGENTELTMRNITLYSQIDALQGKSLTLENVTVRNKIRCGQALFTNVTSGDVTSAAATFTDVTIDGDFNGTDISFNNVLVTKGAYFEQGSLTQVRINGYVTCDSAVFSNAELGQVTCNGDATFKNVCLTAEDRSLIAGGDINLGGELSFAGKIDLAAGKKIILTDRIATDNPIVLALTSAEQKYQIIDGRSEYVSADSNNFVIDGTAWYLKNGQLRRYWYVDGESGDDSNIGSEDHPLKTVHKAVESAASKEAESIIYVRGQTEEDACMDILYDVEIYPWGYVDDESWTGGHEVIHRDHYIHHPQADGYYESQRTFIKVHENALLKARYIKFDGYKLDHAYETDHPFSVQINIDQAAGITVAGGDLDIKHCILYRFLASIIGDTEYYCGGAGALSLYNTNENEKTILLEDLTIDSCQGCTDALIVGSVGFDSSPLNVKIGKNVNIIGGGHTLGTYGKEYIYSTTGYFPTIVRLDGIHSEITVTEDFAISTYFLGDTHSDYPDYLIYISAGTFTIDNGSVIFPDKTNKPNASVNGICLCRMRSEDPQLKIKGTANIYSSDDVALTMVDKFSGIDYTSGSKLNIISNSSSSKKKGTGIELIGVRIYYWSTGKLNVSGFDTGIRCLNPEGSTEYAMFDNYVTISNCKTAIEIGNSTQSGNAKFCKVSENMFQNNTYNVKFNNTEGNKLTLGDSSASTNITQMLFDCKNTTVMNGVINIASIPINEITLDLTNDLSDDIENVFTITGSDTISDIISKFNLITPGYSLQQGSDANHISIKKTN